MRCTNYGFDRGLIKPQQTVPVAAISARRDEVTLTTQ